MSHDLVAISANWEHLSGHYKLLNTIGEGTYAKMKWGQHIPTGTEVAVKIVKQQGFANLHRLLLREVSRLKALQHLNIVQLSEVIDNEEPFFLIMEHMSGGNVLDYLKTHGCKKAKEAQGVFRQLVPAMHYCHQRGIAHRELKLQNVLFNSKMNAKIADFGFSTKFSASKLSTICGSPFYAALELFLGHESDGPAVDTWRLGVMLYGVVPGTLPFKGSTWRQLGQQVLQGKYAIPFFLSLKWKTSKKN
ncbi:hypothetical protein mRhiFer1_008264 [Rhinolophus ferrumequinum]|uniref:non-specific serine/threonine protein kinase n=1 Tax=Rhinolophus ferrumequinum TaxID=59479 RepID=A0A7J7VRA0_RHIFE|nr:hypothetical protein mRhiFer1_008264 [Rhinolophus ferrumequinum]